MSSEVLTREELFRIACRAALRDGVLEDAEESVLRELREALGLSLDAAHSLHQVVKAKVQADPGAGALAPEEVYREAVRVALADGVIAPEESSLLKTLGKVLSIDPDRRRALFAEGLQSRPPGR